MQRVIGGKKEQIELEREGRKERRRYIYSKKHCESLSICDNGKRIKNVRKIWIGEVLIIGENVTLICCFYRFGSIRALSIFLSYQHWSVELCEKKNCMSNISCYLFCVLSLELVTKIPDNARNDISYAIRCVDHQIYGAVMVNKWIFVRLIDVVITHTQRE